MTTPQDRRSRGRIDLEVEPLSDLAWQRIERGLMSALDRGDHETRTTVAPVRRRRPVGRWAAVAAIAGAAAAVTFVALPRGERPAATRATSRIVTDEAASSVSIGDVALVVAPDSAVLVDDQRRGGVLIVLERGSVDCEVAPRGERPPLAVLAGDVRVEVVGTHFAVSREGDAARVVVFEGVVEVIAPGEAARIGAGQAWPAAPHFEEGEFVEVPEDAGPRARPPARVPRHAPETARPGPPAAPGGAGDGEPTAKVRYEEAARLEAGDPDAARAIYRELAAGRGAWAANGLYAIARLEEDLGHAGQARALLEAYLRRFPAGANAVDARVILGRLRRPEQDQR